MHSQCNNDGSLGRNYLKETLTQLTSFPYDVNPKEWQNSVNRFQVQ